MKRQKQLFRHRPDDGVWGDCYRTAVACLLDVAPETVPHVYDGPDAGGVPLMREWLRGQGLSLVSMAFDCDLHQLQATMAHLNPGCLYLLSGKSSIGAGHVVIARDQEIVWDPSLDDSGIVDRHPHDNLYWVELIVPSFMEAA